MQSVNQYIMLYLAKKYIWWKPPGKAIEAPARVMVQVMNIGDYDDVQTLVEEVGDDRLIEVLQNSGPGELNERSWVYWHYRLGLASLDQVPPLPVRRFA